MWIDDLMFKVCNLCEKYYEFKEVREPAAYVVDGKVVGLGYTYVKVPLDEHWQITLSKFFTHEFGLIDKNLLHYIDTEKRQYNRCHSYYIDGIDIADKGGNYGDFYLEEIIASLINHKENFNESNCDSCRGENPLQTHFIQLLG